MKIKTAFEIQYSLVLIEYFLYLRDRNPLKKTGHIWGKSTIFSYCRWNNHAFELTVPQKYLDMDTLFSFPCHTSIWDFSKEELLFIETYTLLNSDTLLSKKISQADRKIFPFISLLFDWYEWNFEKHILEKYDFQEEFLYHFILSISTQKHTPETFYFQYGHMFDLHDIKSLLTSYSQNPHYLFTSIALAWYFFERKDFLTAWKFFKNALNLDPQNPWVMAKFALLYMMDWGYENLVIAEKMMLKVEVFFPHSPWVITWKMQVLNALGKYGEVWNCFKKYEEETHGKMRHFEAYLFYAQSLLHLWDFFQSRKLLEMKEKYYFWEWYRYLYNEVDSKLKVFWF